MEEMEFKVKCLTAMLQVIADNLPKETQKAVLKGLCDLAFTYTVNKDGQVEGPDFVFKDMTVKP